MWCQAHSSSEHERGSSLWFQTVLEMLMFLGLLLSLAALGEIGSVTLSVHSIDTHI